MKRFKLKEGHPTLEKVRTLEKLAEELGITLNFTRGYPVNLTDGGKSYRIEDLETHNAPLSFPAFSEYVLIKK